MRTTAGTGTFYEVLTAAVTDIANAGYDSTERLEYWLAELRAAANRDMMPEDEMTRNVRQSLSAIFDRLVTRAGLLQRNPDVGRFTLERIRPQLRDELDRRILASVNLIRLNRDRAIETTLQRFSGWATSIPVGGSDAVRRNPTRSAIRQSLARTPFEVRRCTIDQGHKLASNLNDILARDSGAIAGRWEQHYTRFPREVHTERNGLVYLVRDSWADRRGFVRGDYMDQYEMPGELVLCRCTYRYLFHLRQLPADMLTQEGRESLERVRLGIAA